MFSSKIYPFSYTRNKSKEFYCLCYVVKLFLYFSFFIFPSFQCLCHMKNCYFFLDGSHLFGDSFFIFKECYYNTRKRLYRQLQVPIIIFNKKALELFLASPTQRTHHEIFWVLYRELFLMNVSKAVWNCFSFTLILNYW